MKDPIRGESASPLPQAWYGITKQRAITTGMGESLFKNDFNLFFPF
jgi:hypothetical protein